MPNEIHVQNRANFMSSLWKSAREVKASVSDIIQLQVICQQDVRCQACKWELEYQNCLNQKCDAVTAPHVSVQAAPPQNPQPMELAPQHTLKDLFTELSQGQISKDVARLSSAAVKLLVKESDDGGTARLPSLGKVWKYVFYCF